MGVEEVWIERERLVVKGEGRAVFVAVEGKAQFLRLEVEVVGREALGRRDELLAAEGDLQPVGLWLLLRGGSRRTPAADLPG